jgi:AraC family transcriptional regulator
MDITYNPQIDEAGAEAASDRIQILAPGDNGGFQVQFQPTAGTARRAAVRAPQVCVIPPRQAHRLSAERPTDLVTISIDRTFFDMRVRDAFGADRDVAESYGALDPFLRGFCNSLRTAFRTGEPPAPAYLESMAGAIAAHVATHYHRALGAAAPCAGLAPHKLQRVLACIEERLAEPIQVKELASLVHMSPFHFARMFKLATGHPPHAYITAQRMERAKKLLSDSDLSLVEVAARVGYQTQAHFTGVFHHHVGTTPRVFRVSSRARQPA